VQIIVTNAKLQESRLLFKTVLRICFCLHRTLVYYVVSC